MPTQPIYAMLDTWSSGVTTYKAISINVTDAASATDSKLIDLLISGASKFSVDKAGNLVTAGGATVGGTFATTGGATVGGTLDVTGAATLGAGLDVTGDTAIDGALGVTGAATLDDELNVTGDTALGAGLGVAGNATVGGTLGVTGNATLTGAAGIGGNATIGGNAEIGGSLDVTGAATLEDDLNVGGNAAIAGDLTADSLSLTDALPIASGGTGGKTAADARTNLEAQRLLGLIASIDIGNLLTGNRATGIDLHASGNPNALDYSARLNRAAGVNGALEVVQTGTGNINITGGGDLQRNGNKLWDANNLRIAEGEGWRSITFGNMRLLIGSVVVNKAQEFGAIVYPTPFASPPIVIAVNGDYNANVAHHAIGDIGSIQFAVRTLNYTGVTRVNYCALGPVA